MNRNLPLDRSAARGCRIDLRNIRVVALLFMLHVTAAWIAISLSSAASAAPPVTVIYVDDSAAAGGDGSAQSPLQTIQEGIALLGRKGGIVAIHPGTYCGPILVDRDDVILWGLADPVYDSDGYLDGFVSEDLFDNEVVITMDRMLGELGGPEPEDVVELRGNNNQVHNIVLELATWHWTLDPECSAVSAKAEDDDFYDNIVLSHLLFRHQGTFVNDIWTRKANVQIEYVTSLDPGAVGMNPSGNGHVEIVRSHVAKKSANICFLGLFERPGEENGPSFLTGSVRDCILIDANDAGGTGWRPGGEGLLIVGRTGISTSNPEQPSTMILNVSGNTFDHNQYDILVAPLGYPSGVSTEQTLIDLTVTDNAFLSHPGEVVVDFKTEAGEAPPQWAANSSVLVVDEDGAFPDSEGVDLGPAENGNEYLLLE